MHNPQTTAVFTVLRKIAAAFFPRCVDYNNIILIVKDASNESIIFVTLAHTIGLVVVIFLLPLLDHQDGTCCHKLVQCDAIHFVGHPLKCAPAIV